jgi:uncharacterized damage-inducible protein DinB
MNAHNLQYRAQANYNAWFNIRLYDACATLSDEYRRLDRGAFFGSIHRTLNHILLGDRIWLSRFEALPGGFECFRGSSLVRGHYVLSDELCADFGELREARSATDAVITGLADELSESQLVTTMRYANSKGEERSHPTWVALSHLFNHQTHHRGQVTALLFQAGVDPGVTDFFVPTVPFVAQ